MQEVDSQGYKFFTGIGSWIILNLITLQYLACGVRFDFYEKNSSKVSEGWKNRIRRTGMEESYNSQEHNRQENAQGNAYQQTISDRYQRATYDVPMNVSVGDWMVTLLIVSIPVVGLVMLFVWGFGSSTNLSKQNWAKAELIWMLIAIVIWTLLMIFYGALFIGLIGSLGSRY